MGCGLLYLLPGAGEKQITITIRTDLLFEKLSNRFEWRNGLPGLLTLLHTHLGLSGR